MNEKPYKISPYDYGLGKALDMYGAGKCGYFGDNTAEEPSILSVVAYYRWGAWTKYNGTPKELCQKIFLNKV